MAKVIELTTPLSEEAISQLKVGDVVTITGNIYTGRDAVLPRIVKAAKDGTLQGGIAMYDLANDCVGYAVTDILSEEAKAAVEEAKAKIISGEIVVPRVNEDFVAKYGEGLYTLDESLN